MRLASLWEPFGLRSSPFFQDELSPTDSEHPISLFVGRDTERSRINLRLRSDPKSRSIVQGPAGVGKTSFVNRVKADAAAYGIVSYAQPIRIISMTTHASFVADALRTLIRIRSSADLPNDHSFWQRTIRLLEGQDIFGGSISVAGYGAGVTRSYIPPQVAPDSLFEHLGDALSRMREDLGAPVLLHVNNLENLSETSIDLAAQLILDLRDYLQITGAHWIFVGAEGVDSAVFRRHKQVAGIFPDADTLVPLGPDEIADMLDLRYQHLALPKQKVTPPISPSDAARLYTLYAGDLRNFLRLLTDAAEQVLGSTGVRPMTVEDVLRSTRARYAAHLSEQITEADLKHLSTIVEALADSSPEFRVSDAAAILKISASGASQLLNRLREKHVIFQTRTEGKSVYYRPIGSALVVIGRTPAP